MRVLVTGVAGFIGGHIAARCAAAGHEVIGVDDLSGGTDAPRDAGYAFIQKDLAEPDVAAALPARCDAVLHLAGQSSGEISFDDPVADLRKNTISTLNLIDYARRTQAERLIYASSMSVYGATPDAPAREDWSGRPLSCYGVGKQTSERYLAIFAGAPPSLSFRMFNVYGPGQNLRNLRQGMVSIFVAQALKTGEIVVKGALDRFRDFIHVDDVVEMWMRALAAPLEGASVVNLGTGRKTTVAQLLEQIAAAAPGIAVRTEGVTPGDQSGVYADIGALTARLGPHDFVSVEDGVKRFVAWAREQAG